MAARSANAVTGGRKPCFRLSDSKWRVQEAPLSSKEDVSVAKTGSECPASEQDATSIIWVWRSDLPDRRSVSSALIPTPSSVIGPSGLPIGELREGVEDVECRAL